MFVLSEAGDIYIYKIEESRSEVDLFGRAAQPFMRGELMVLDAPLKIKDIGKIK